MDGFEQVGTGLTVYEDDAVIEGPVRWLDSPAAVIDFVNGGRVADTVVLARGGTTTFLTPALTSGVKGVMTLQGAPESHLGILSREYGIPCLMSVAFTSGVRSARGEVIPADGTIVRMDVSTAPQGRVLARPGAPVSHEPLPEQPAGPSEEELAQLQALLRNYRGETPHGSEGDRLYRQRLTTNVLFTGGDDRDLERGELNDLLSYMGFNLWDQLAARATEGESGLIPRQEYEAFGCVQCWQRYPELVRFITDEIGVDGVREIGGLSRHEIGTKVNLLHIWANGYTSAFGRGISMGLGRIAAHEREADLAASLQFMRRLYRGAWGGAWGGADQPIFTSMRDYAAPLLDKEWTERFSDEVTWIDDPDTRARYQLFSADTELMGFLLHFDNRCGLHDTGPYPTADGGFMIVRDHFLSDDLYHWADVAADLPHAITQAMFFAPGAPIEVALQDIGTIYTRPGNYLRHLTGLAVYARDRWDTPAGQVRRLGEDEMHAIRDRCRDASTRLYRRIAAMSRRDKVMAGGQVYYTDFLAPFARAAGLWDRVKDEFDFFEWDPAASEAYYPLVTGNVAAELVPRLFLTGAGFPPVKDAISGEEAFPALHLLALRGCSAELPVDPNELASAGLVASTSAGYVLTEAGRGVHERQLGYERRTYEAERLTQAYERFLAQNGPMKTLVSRWQTADESARAELLVEAAEILTRVRVALRRTNEQLLRFEGYLPRLRKALARVEAGEHEYLAGPKVDSVHTVWLELHEDYLLTQGISREQEGGYQGSRAVAR